MSNDGDGPGGYRDAARPAPGAPSSEDLDLDASMSDGPIVRLANALLLQLSQDDGPELLRVDSRGGPAVTKRPGKAWEEMMILEPRVSPPVLRRLKLMASLPIQTSQDPMHGFLRLKLGRGREVDFVVHVRPRPDGEVLIMRRIPEERRVLEMPPSDEPDLGPLRWDAEHAFRTARGPRASSSVPLLVALIDALTPRGAGAIYTQVRAAWTLAETARDTETRALALRGIEAAHDVVKGHLGDGPVLADVLHARAHVLAELDRMDEALALLADAIAILVRGYAEDPFAAHLHAKRAEWLDAEGRSDEARAARDTAIAIVTALSGPDDPAIAELRAVAQGGSQTL